MDASPERPSKQSLEQLQLEVRRMEAREYKRRLMQGLGRPIISSESNGYRLVFVGTTAHWSKSWLTFLDFLSDFIKKKLTPEWGNIELKKPDGECHPLITWYRKLCAFQQKHSTGEKRKIYSAVPIGAVRAYYGLAYDLYLSAHNAELPERLLKRLRNPDQFEGAVYEAAVIGIFAKAEFKIEFEDEDDPSSTHCEFTATHLRTGKKFSVEVKAVTKASKRSGASTEAARVRNQLAAALKKKAKHDRIVFIELNRLHRIGSDGVPDWVQDVDRDLAEAEVTLKVDGKPAPPAYVFITNRAFVNDLDGTEMTEIGLSTSFKIPDFPPGRNASTLLEAIEARERHLEVYWLQKAMDTHSRIPTSFDEKSATEAFGGNEQQRLRIGDTHTVPDKNGKNVRGKLLDATVLKESGIAAGVYQLESGETAIYHVPLTDSEIAEYEEHPDTFFGVIKESGKSLEGPIQAFDFMFATYGTTSKEKLLEFMADSPLIEYYKSLGQRELARIYCASIASQIWEDSQRAKATPSPPNDGKKD